VDVGKKHDPYTQRNQAGETEKEQTAPVVSQLDGQRGLKTSVSQSVESCQECEGLGSQHQGNANVNAQEHREAAFAKDQPPKMQTMLMGETGGHS
jgi:hypothetical protein